MIETKVMALKSTGESARILFEYSAPLATKWARGKSTRRDKVDDKGKVIEEDSALETVGGRDYVDVLLAPQSPGHSPRFQTVRRENLVDVRTREASFV